MVDSPHPNVISQVMPMHYLFSVYFVNKPRHVSGIFIAHHQEVYCIYTTAGTLLFFLDDCLFSWLG
jgi:hypothetical protein